MSEIVSSNRCDSGAAERRLQEAKRRVGAAEAERISADQRLIAAYRELTEAQDAYFAEALPSARALINHEQHLTD